MPDVTKREQAAIAAMQGLLASGERGSVATELAVEQADALLARLNGPAPTPEPPPIPGKYDVTFEIDAQKTYAISPLIYGVNHYRLEDEHPAWASSGRMGGNNWTPYNFKNNATNAGVDYHHFNSSFLGGGETPAGAVTGRVDKILAKGARPIIQIPMSDYVAADKLDGDVASSPEYLSTRFRKNAPWFWPGADQAGVYQSDLFKLLAEKYGYENLFFSLDNEPDSWGVTHPRILAKQTYASYMARVKEYAHLVREAGGSSTKIFAPSLTGYMGFLSFGGATDAAGRNFVSFFLGEMKKESDTRGKRQLDVLDIHWYPEHRGANGIRVTDDDGSPETARARVEAPRSLWDPTFKENSWITNDVIKKPIALLPDLRTRIAAAFPGTLIGLTEYYYGGGQHISGAVAQADVLGIFGREGVFAANMWRWGSGDDRFIFGGFKCFRDFDGAGGKFGDTGLAATSSDPVMSSVYASSSGVVVMINKATAPKKALIRFKGAPVERAASTWLLAGDNPNPRPHVNVAHTASDAYAYEMPAMSVTVMRL